MKRSTLAPWAAVLAVSAVMPACQKRDAPAPETQAQSAPVDSAAAVTAVAPTQDELANATYEGFQLEKHPVKLTAGHWEGGPAGAGDAARIDLARSFLLTGDVDGDGADEAVVLLSESGGGTGNLLDLAVVDRQASRLRNVATVLLGDRVQVRGARIEEGRILVDLVQAGAQDALCCPGELLTRGWHLLPSGLEEFVTSAKSGRLSLATLAGNEWLLRSWKWDEAAPDVPEVTLAFQDGKFVGTSGCNRYFAPASPGDMPGDVSVGPAGATRMSCPEPAMQVEDRFLDQLAGVKKFGFVAGQLALTYDVDGDSGVMLFDRREAPAAGEP